MKKLFNRLKAVAFVLAVALAVFTNVKKTSAATLQVDYFWFTEYMGNYYFTGIDNTKPYMQDLTGCTGTSYVCLYGFRPEDFNEYGNPSSGFIANPSTPVVIREI
jgi:hypothetical protein